MDSPSFKGEGRDDSPSRLRVLVVDANADAADSWAILLGWWGYDVRVAYTGPNGLDVARTYHPDVVLSEIPLPGMDGYLLARHLRAEFEQVELIAVTGYGQKADQIRAQDAGFTHHFLKPADPGEVHELLAYFACHLAALPTGLAERLSPLGGTSLTYLFHPSAFSSPEEKHR